MVPKAMLVIDGDPEGFKKAVRESATAMDDLQRSGEKLTTSTKQQETAANRYIEALKREAIQLGANEAALRAYEIAQLGLSQKAQQQVEQLHKAIDAHKQAEAAAKAHGDSWERVGRQIGNALNRMAAAAAAAWGVMQAGMTQQITEFEQSTIRLQATLRATGFAAGKTFAELEAQIARLAKITFFDDEKLREAATALLRFKDIHGEAFNQALELSADLAASMGTDLVSAARQVGAALQDPERAIRMLADAGRNLSSSQRAVIKDLLETGQHGRAMQIMLDELRGTYGGLAEELNTGMKRSTSEVKKAWDDLLETLGRSDAVGGATSRLFRSTADVLRDIDDLLTRGLGDKLARAAGFALHIAAGGMDLIGKGAAANVMRDQAAAIGGSTYGANPNAPKIPTASIGDQGAAAAGRQQQEAAAAAERVFSNLNDTLGETIRVSTELGRENDRAAKEYERLRKSVGDYVKGVEDEAAKIGMTAAQRKEYDAQQKISVIRNVEERDALQKRLDVAIKSLKVDEDRDQQRRRAASDFDRILRLEKEHERALDASVNAAERELAGLQKSNEEYGLSRAVIEEHTLAKLEGTLATLDFEKATYKEVDALEKRIDLQRQIVAAAKQGDSMRETVKVWNELASKGAAFFTDLVFRGRSAFRELGDEAKRFGAQMIAIFGQRVLLNVGASIVGGSAGAALANQAASYGSATMAGSVLDWGMGAMGIGGAGAMGQFVGGLSGSIAGPAMPGTALAYGQAAGANLSSFGFGSAAAGAGLAGLAGGAVGYFGSGALGAGERGQQVGGISGATLAAIGTMIWPGVGTIIGAVLGALIGKFTDPDGLAERRASFGTAPRGTPYSYSARTPFGTFGTFGDEWFSDDDMGESMQAFMGMMGNMETRYAGMLNRDQRARISAAINQPREYSFGTEHGEFAGALGMVARDRLAIIGEELVPGLGELISAFEGTVEELFTFVDGMVMMQQSVKDIDRAIMDLTGDFAGAVMVGIQDLRDRLTDAQAEWEAAVESADPAKMASAEQELLAAIHDRYQTEINLVRQLQAAIDAAQQEAYQFAVNIAQRINMVGGSRDIGGIALNRAGVLQGSIGGDLNPARQIRNLGQYVGAIDTWYQSRRAQIESDINAQAAAHQAAAQAASAVYQARISSLQEELQLVQQWAGVLDRAKQMIDQMQLTAVNPLHAAGRYQIAAGMSGDARAAYLSASGADRSDAANKYLDSLNAQLGLLGETHQRPSLEYQAGYNEIMRQVREVEAVAKPQAERAIELQRQLVTLQEQANAVSSASFNVQAAMDSAMQSLNEEALGYYTWAEDQGERLYNLTEQQNQEQLDAITGGMEAELYIAKLAKEEVELLTDVRTDIRALPARLAEQLRNAGFVGPGGSDSGNNGTTGGQGDTGVLTDSDKRLVKGTISEFVDKRVDEIFPFMVRKHGATVR